MNLKIGVIKGDGIGPEIVTEAMKVLDKVAEVYGHTCEYTQLLMGGASIDVHGIPLTDETIRQAKACDAVLSPNGIWLREGPGMGVFDTLQQNPVLKIEWQATSV